MEKTGRVFKCIGLKEKLNHCWKLRFKIGILYYEIQNIYKINNSSETLLLKEEFNDNTWFVDKDQFELQ
jgi:hypothetical protein